MGGIDSIDEERMKATSRVIEMAHNRLALEVINEIKKFPKEALSMGLQDAWEEFKYQVQRGESALFGVFEESVRGMCEGLVQELGRDQTRLMWLWSDKYLEWDSEDGDMPDDESMSEAVSTLVYERVASLADGEELVFDPDESRQREAFGADFIADRNGSDADQADGKSDIKAREENP